MNIVINKKVTYDYKLLKSFEAGLVLNGWEIKSLRNKEVSIKESFVIIKKNEAFVINMNITPYVFSTQKFSNLDPTRTRKLLLNKKEIKEIQKDIKLQKVIVVPKRIYIKHNIAKIEIWTAKAKKLFDKRNDIKSRESKRNIDRNYKNNY